jgi:hypothetical protein
MHWKKAFDSAHPPKSHSRFEPIAHLLYHSHDLGWVWRQAVPRPIPNFGSILLSATTGVQRLPSPNVRQARHVELQSKPRKVKRRGESWRSERSLLGRNICSGTKHRHVESAVSTRTIRTPSVMKTTKDSHRFDALSALAANVNTEHTMTPPFSLACESVQPSDVAQSRFHRSSLKVKPIKWGGAIRIIQAGKGTRPRLGGTWR